MYTPDQYLGHYASDRLSCHTSYWADPLPGQKSGKLSIISIIMFLKTFNYNS